MLNEGGNFSVGGVTAKKIDLEKLTIPRFRELINDFIFDFNAKYKKEFGEQLWKSTEGIFNGSTSFILDPDIPEDRILKSKKFSGDVDIAIPEDSGKNVFKILEKIKRCGDLKFIGMSANNENALGTQIITLWKYEDFNIQIDLELNEFENDSQSKFSRFAHSSSIDDVEQNIKGVHHKYLLRAIVAAISMDTFRVATNKSSKEKITLAKNQPKYPHKLGFSVDKGLAQKYELIDGDIWRELKASEKQYTKDPEKMFEMIFPGKKYSKDFESFTGLTKLVSDFDSNIKNKILDFYFETLFGKGAQVIESFDLEKDKEVKIAGLNYFMNYHKLKIADLDGKIKEYYSDKKARTQESINEDDKSDFAKTIINSLRKDFPNSTFKSLNKNTFKVNAQELEDYVRKNNIETTTKKAEGRERKAFEINGLYFLASNSSIKKEKNNTLQKEMGVCFSLREITGLEIVSDLDLSKFDPEMINSGQVESAKTIKSNFNLKGFKIHYNSNLVSKIRRAGSSLSSVAPDKWCPADFYLIKDESRINFDSLEELNKSISDEKNVIGISLKEESGARFGKIAINTLCKYFGIPMNVKGLDVTKDDFKSVYQELVNTKISKKIFVTQGKGKSGLDDSKVKAMKWLADFDQREDLEEIITTGYLLASNQMNLSPDFYIVQGASIKEKRNTDVKKSVTLDSIVLPVDDRQIKFNINDDGSIYKFQLRDFGTSIQFEVVSKADADNNRIPIKDFKLD